MKKLKPYLIACLAATVLALTVFAFEPVTYAAEVKISTERKQTDLLIGLSSMTAWAKQRMASLKGVEGMMDPEIYSLFVSSRSFAKELSAVHVEGFNCDYFHYLQHHHRQPWWTSLWERLNPQPEESRVLDIIQKNLRYKLYRKQYTMVIQVRDADPVVAALMTDSARVLLQKQITRYHIAKAENDLRDATRLKEQTRKKYQEAQTAYTRYADEEYNAQLPSASEKRQKLEKDRDNAFNTYNTACEQYIRAQALLQRRIPSFATVKAVSVPSQKAAPQWYAYWLPFVFIALVVTWWGQLYKKRTSWTS